MRSVYQPQANNKLLHVLRTMLATGVAYAVNYGITLLLTPYITRTVGTEAYGFVTLAKQFSQYAAILTTALNTYAARYIGLCYHQNDTKQANVYFSSVFFGDLALACLILGLTAVALPFLQRVLSIPGAIVTDVKMLFLFTGVSFWVTTVCSVFGCAGYIQDRMDLTGLFKTLSYVTNALVLLIAYLLFPARVCYVGLGALAAALIVAVSDGWLSRRLLPQLTPRRRDFSIAAVRRLVVDGFWQSFNLVGDLLNNGLDLLVCNQLLTSLAMGQLAIAKTMHTIIHSLYTVVDQAFIPRFLQRYAAGDREGLLDELKISMKASGLLANVTFAGFVALGPAYYRLWIPGQDIDLIYRLTVVTILTCIPNGAVHPLYYIYTLTVKKKIPCYVTVAGGIVNVIGMYVLIRYAGMGVYAVAWTTVAVMAVINFVTNPLYMAHVLQLPPATFYPDILRNVLACGALTAAFQLLAALYTPGSWAGLIACAAAYALIGAPLHLLIACNKKQRNRLMGLLKKKTA
ncbi:MAG: lipopolysaccharide biosynthesis protein [Clostridia bacterium]|nr:lipopolysaccharide biosynthesis protein [Clostridia bacterium]